LAAIGAVTVCHRIADIIFEPKIFDPNSSSARFSNQGNEAGRYTKGSQKSIGKSRGGAMTVSLFRRGSRRARHFGLNSCVGCAIVSGAILASWVTQIDHA
jgi:hypothetical protein